MKNFTLEDRSLSEPNKRTRDRYRLSDSEWVASFSCSHLKILIVCRGPIRKEAMDVFADMGADYGILISEKDSVAYPHTLAPELRLLKDQNRIHRVVDYTGATTEERRQRIAQIIGIARDYKYTHIFAGYGFMAEDAEFVESIEDAGIGFIGPASGVHRMAGSKDTAKVLARKLDVSVTPGLDNITTLTLIDKVGGKIDGLKKLISDHKLNVEPDGKETIEELADKILIASYRAGAGLLTVEDLQKKAEQVVEGFLKENPGKRFRLKYIGGGGGKGQRIVRSVDEVKEAVFQVLSESKATGDADNKNFLIELNVETTRHNEIQLIGNGEWCLALGGRDCSVQMHEQKLLELSITEELYQHEIEVSRNEGLESHAKTLEKDLESLREMEAQAERFGSAVSLNSASTFECIVSDNSFFFMEMNTRIQVEHRVTEMAYTLRFENPYNENDFFVVESLVETMVLLAVHGKRLPKPVRVPNNRAGGEVRLNATDDVLKPNAGGMIEYWSSPVKHELRDDQGIGVRNPDTGWFMLYHLAGAYDSNIALIVTYGSGRRENLDRLSDILRQMEIRGQDLKTNLGFHYGLLSFLLGTHPMLKTDTSFVLPYLSAVGSLAKEMESFDVMSAWEDYNRRIGESYGSEAQSVLVPKVTFVTRPLRHLMNEPHLAMGFLSLHNERSFSIDSDEKIQWLRNPLQVLKDLYVFVRMEERENTPPSQKIWDHDKELMEQGLKFYEDLERSLSIDTREYYNSTRNGVKKGDGPARDVYANLDRSLRDSENPFVSGKHGIKVDSFSDDLFFECSAAHRGWQLGVDLLDAFIIMGKRAGIFGFEVNPDLTLKIPEQFLDPELRKDYSLFLSPPPKATADTIVAVSGGMFYARETPDSPRFVDKGQHFNEGDPLYIVEVMKMFNKILAEFSGTIEEVLLDGDAGVVVKKGDPLFKVKPDVEIAIESEDERMKRVKERTREIVGQIWK